MKPLGDALLIVAWLTIIALNLPYNGWLIALSVLYWFSSNEAKVEIRKRSEEYEN